MIKLYAATCALSLLAFAAFAQQATEQAQQDTGMQQTLPTQMKDSAASPGTAAAAANISEKDRKFIDKAVRVGLLEVRLTELAKEKASDPQIKEWATKALE